MNVFFSQQELSGDSGEIHLIATRNEERPLNSRIFEKEMGYQIENLNDYPDLPEVRRNWDDFVKNARLKQRLSPADWQNSVADDSGASDVGVVCLEFGLLTLLEMRQT